MKLLLWWFLLLDKKLSKFHKKLPKFHKNEHDRGTIHGREIVKFGEFLWNLESFYKFPIGAS